jgi:hypothetical protein
MIHQDIVTTSVLAGWLEDETHWSVVVAQLALTRETGRILGIRIPFVLTLVDVAITVRVDVRVGGIHRIETEVIFPSGPHSIIIVILMIDF